MLMLCEVYGAKAFLFLMGFKLTPFRSQNSDKLFLDEACTCRKETYENEITNMDI